MEMWNCYGKEIWTWKIVLGILGSQKPEEWMDLQSRINGYEELMDTKKKDFDLEERVWLFQRKAFWPCFPPTIAREKYSQW